MEEKGVKVLIVDDDDDMRSFLNQILVRNGFIVEEAGDTQEGLKKVLPDKPDIILLDGNRPQLDGLEMFRLLRADPETRSIMFLGKRSRVKDCETKIGDGSCFHTRILTNFYLINTNLPDRRGFPTPPPGDSLRGRRHVSRIFHKNGLRPQFY